MIHDVVHYEGQSWVVVDEYEDGELMLENVWDHRRTLVGKIHVGRGAPTPE